MLTIKKWSKFLGDRDFIAGDYVTYVDFILYDAIDYHLLLAGNSDAIKPFDNLIKFMDRIENLPRLKEFFASKRFSRFPIWRPETIWAGQGAHHSD